MKTRTDYFITGTDTGVGKTMVTASLLAALRANGMDAVAMKPVQTGARRGRSSDLDFCARVAKWTIPADEYDNHCPYRFPLAASPHLAARVAGREIDPKRIIKTCQRLQARHESVLVEGAGGVRVPLCGEYEQRDLMAALKLPVLVVARAGLGTLNHTMLTVEALRTRRIRIAGVVLSNPDALGGAIVSENLAFLRKTLSPIPVIALGPLRPGTFVRAGRKLLEALSAE